MTGVGFQLAGETALRAHLAALPPGGRVAVFGSGPIGDEARRICIAAGRRPVGVLDDYATDREPRGGVPVIETGQLAALAPEAVILATLKARRRMKSRLQALGFRGAIWELPGEDNDPFWVPPASERRTADLEPYRGRHAGRRAFVIGNGPSLARTPPPRLRGEITFGCNGIFLLEGFVPTYYCVEDVLVAEDRAAQINGLPWTKFFPADLQRFLTHGHFFNVERVAWVDRFAEDFAQGIQVNATVTFTMIQLAFFMGCDPVYLIGVDHSYKVDPQENTRTGSVLKSQSDDPNHFHPDYFGKGYRWHDPRVERMEAAYLLAREAFERNGRKIRNATSGGRLEVFERASFEELARQSEAGTAP